MEEPVMRLEPMLAASDTSVEAPALPGCVKAEAPRDVDRRCRDIYLKIALNTWRFGIEEREVAQSRDRYCYQEGANFYLKPEATKPTGLALGHPLPDAKVARRLWLLSKAVEHKLAELGAFPTFAFVPPWGYHITIFNRSHFDREAVFDLNQREKAQAEQVIASVSTGPVIVDIDGLLLSSDGRLLVRGFPLDGRLFELRRGLTSVLPNAGGGTAPIAHLKLGDFLVCPSRERFREFLGWLGRCSQHLSHRLVFEDVYTPTGGIHL